MQHFDDYQTFTDSTLVLPLDQANNVGYSALGLVGEVGEYAEKIHTLYSRCSVFKRTLPPAPEDTLIDNTTKELLDVLAEVKAVCAKAEKLKKEIRSGEKRLPASVIKAEDEKDSIAKELGDICWYVARASSALRMTFSQVISINVKKLLGRIQRGVIHGWGDNR